jgi:hypothetical protein
VDSSKQFPVSVAGDVGNQIQSNHSIEALTAEARPGKVAQDETGLRNVFRGDPELSLRYVYSNYCEALCNQPRGGQPGSAAKI